MTGRRFKKSAGGAPKKKSSAFKLIMIFLGIIAPIALGIVGFTVEVNGKPIILAGFDRLFGGSGKTNTKLEDEGPTEEQKEAAKKAVEEGQKEYNAIKDLVSNIEAETGKETYDREKILSQYPRLYDQIDDGRVKIGRHKTINSDANDLHERFEKIQNRLDTATVKAVKAAEEAVKNGTVKEIQALKESLNKQPFNKDKAKETYEKLYGVINKIYEPTDKIFVKMLSDKLYSSVKSLFDTVREERKKLVDIKAEIDKK